METLVTVLMVLVAVDFSLKQTFNNRWYVLGISVVCAVFTALVWPWAIEQSKTQITDWLNDTQLMLDTSVVLTCEVALQMAFCLVAAHVLTSDRLPKRTVWLYRILRWFPGVLIFVVLFSALTQLIFAMPGHSFQQVAIALAAAVLVLVPLLTYALRLALPEKDIRLELLFLTHALTIILGIVATVNGKTTVDAVGKVDLSSLAAICLILAVGTVLGLLLHKHKRFHSNY